MNIDPAKIEALRGLLRKPHVNSTCIGCSACNAISWDVFDMDENCLSVVKPLSDYEDRGVDDAISACPVNAISWQPCNAEWAYLNWVEEHKDVA